MFKYLKDNADESTKVIVNELSETIELTETELEEWQLVICSLLEDFSDEDKIQELLKETFLSWFNQEIEGSYTTAQTLDWLAGLKLTQDIRNLKEELGNASDFEEILEIYARFKKLLDLEVN